jgi:lipoprotein-anchoring transpeptidase ErfK/SrfK
MAASTRPPDRAPALPPRLFASKLSARVRAEPVKDAPRLGYIRNGAVLTATTDQPLGFDACRKGWYGLTTGGYVCAGTDVIPFMGEHLPTRQPLQPDTRAKLPFPYGYSRSSGTPVFRRLPNDDEWARVASEAPVVGAPGEGLAASLGPPTLASLLGDAHSVLLRRMQRGFYVSLDQEVEHGTRTFWHTQAAGFIEKERLAPVEGSNFHGVPLSENGLALPVAFVIGSKISAHALDAKGQLHPTGAELAYHSVFAVAAQNEVAGKPYVVAADGGYYATHGVTLASQRAKPREVGDDEKWIDADLSTQTLVAYVGSKPVYATAISSGRIRDESDPLRDFRTPTGSFRITGKHISSTMDGDVAQDGPYSIEDVPYVMYFSLAYALHTAFWHDSFGRPHSHGCINLAPLDAKWLFFWSEPRLPPDWHGVYATTLAPGTRVYVHGDTPKG